MNKGAACLYAIIVVGTAALAGCAQQPAQSESSGTAGVPPRDISGVWVGPVIPQKETYPPMTEWGQAFFDSVKPLSGPRAVPIAETTDPLVTCDPLGFPRNVLYETRGFAFDHLPNKTLHLLQYQKVFREIWTDGRKLPTNVNAPGEDTRDPTYYGYSIGSWADDSTFVITTTGFDEAAWADEFGHPRSMNAVIEERYHRIDHDNLELTVKIDDPKAYTQPFVAMIHTYKWSPKQEFEEQLCIPSVALDYKATFTPAAKGYK
jgi:hypothetical protein